MLEQRSVNLKHHMLQLIENQKSVHILYSYNEMKNYIEQIPTYILDRMIFFLLKASEFLQSWKTSSVAC